jgi:hypothetical protein
MNWIAPKRKEYLRGDLGGEKNSQASERFGITDKIVVMSTTFNYWTLPPFLNETFSTATFSAPLASFRSW